MQLMWKCLVTSRKRAAAAVGCVSLDITHLESHQKLKPPCSSVAAVIERFSGLMTLISAGH